MIGMEWGFPRLLAVLSVGLFILAFSSIFRPTERSNFGLVQVRLLLHALRNDSSLNGSHLTLGEYSVGQIHILPSKNYGCN